MIILGHFVLANLHNLYSQQSKCYQIHLPTSRYIFLAQPRGLCFGLRAGLHKFFWMGFHKTWMEDVSQPRIKPIKLLMSIQIRSMYFFPHFLFLWDSVDFFFLWKWCMHLDGTFGIFTYKYTTGDCWALAEVCTLLGASLVCLIGAKQKNKCGISAFLQVLAASLFLSFVPRWAIQLLSSHSVWQTALRMISIFSSSSRQQSDKAHCVQQ